MNTPSTTLNTNTSLKRFAVLDLFRLISVLVIVPFHLSEFSFNSPDHPILTGTLIHVWILKVAKLIPFSGYSVLLLSFFLIGWGQPTPKKILKLVAFSLVGYFVLMVSYYDAPFNLLYWDVYTFLMATLLLSLAVLLLPYGGVLALGFGLLTGSPGLVEWNLEALSGVCTPEYQSAWPLFPWGFFAACFVVLGRELRGRKSVWLLQIQKQVCRFSKGLFLVTVAAAFFVLRNKTGAEMTDGMYCYIQSFSVLQKIFLLWVWTLIFVYGSTPGVNLNWSRKWTEKLAFISWNRNFSLAYINQIFLLGFFTSYSEVFLATSLRYDVTLLAVFVGTEILTHLILAVQSRYRSRES